MRACLLMCLLCAIVCQDIGEEWMWRDLPESTPSDEAGAAPPLIVGTPTPSPAPAPSTIPTGITTHSILMQATLGCPSSSDKTIYAPFPGLEITVPAGAWPSSSRRTAPVLTVAVFTLDPSAVGLPGKPCGPAIALGPDGLELAVAVAVRLPCTNGTAYQWTENGWVGGNASRRLGVQAAFTVVPTTDGSMAAIVLGIPFAVGLVWGAWRRCSRSRVKPRPHVHYV